MLREVTQLPGRERYLLERVGWEVLPVFDTEDIADFLARDEVIPYLSDMLSSFARIETFTLAFREKRGIWRGLRFNTMDIDGLIGFSRILEEEARCSTLGKEQEFNTTARAIA